MASYDKFQETMLVHIYGFPVEDQKIEVKSPAKLFKLPFYGSEDSGEDDDEKMHYVGIKFAEQRAPFQHLYATQSGKFQISNCAPTKEVINQMQSLYPNEVLSCHSFLHNVYTSHYYTGKIMVGYFILGDETVEDLEEILDDSKNVELVSIAHTLRGGFNSFVGKQIGLDFVPFEFSHADEPGNAFYNLCTATYDVNDYKDFHLKFKPQCLTSHKMIAFVPEMCYCCT